MDLEEIGINAGNWVDSTQDRDYWRALVNAALNLRVPYAMELIELKRKTLPLRGCFLPLSEDQTKTFFLPFELSSHGSYYTKLFWVCYVFCLIQVYSVRSHFSLYCLSPFFKVFPSHLHFLYCIIFQISCCSDIFHGSLFHTVLGYHIPKMNLNFCL